MKRNVVVKYLGNDIASDKHWMVKNLLNLLEMNKLNRKITLFEAKLYKVNNARCFTIQLENI